MVMNNHHTSIDEVTEVLLELLNEYLAGKEGSWRETTTSTLQAIFQQWKIEHGSKTPMSYRFPRGLGGRRRIGFEDATPYECAGTKTGVIDYVMLFNHLLVTKYPPLLKLVEDEEFLDLIVLSAFIDTETVEMTSLLHCVRDVYSQALQFGNMATIYEAGLIERAPIIRLGRKSKKTLDENRSKGSKRNREKAVERKATLRKAAIDYFMVNQTATVDECIDFLLARKIGTRRTIGAAIAGCKAEAVQKLKEKRTKQS